MGFFGFSAFKLMFFVVFFIIVATIVANLCRGLKEWGRNNNSPVLHVFATVVTKREEVLRHHNAGDMAMSHSSTRYYVTFEVESGDRMEFLVDGRWYGMLVERDFGTLKFQGTRFLDFERTV